MERLDADESPILLVMVLALPCESDERCLRRPSAQPLHNAPLVEQRNGEVTPMFGFVLGLGSRVRLRAMRSQDMYSRKVVAKSMLCVCHLWHTHTHIT